MRQRDFTDEILEKLANDPVLAEQVGAERLNFQIAEQIVEAREAANLTQAQLARLAKTHQSVIARVEDADYEGRSTRLLHRIANAMGLALRVEFYDPRAVLATGVVEEITESSQAQVPWPSRSVVEWKNLKVNVPHGLKIVA